MTRIAIVHPDLNKKGGAESIAMNVMNALQQKHKIDLITLTPPKIPQLEEYYNISVSIDNIYTEGDIGPILERTTSKLSQAVGIGNFGALDAALINRIARRREQQYDLVFSTMSEMYFEVPSIQYVHYPNFYRRIIEQEGTFLNTLYGIVCSSLAKANNIPQKNVEYISNSEWTAERFQEIYDRHPKVVHPPIDSSEFNPVPWEDRKEGILTVGRISKDKRIIDILDTFSLLKDSGYAGELHLVGPVHDKQYLNDIKQSTESIPDVHLHGPLSRAELTTMMSEYKYGLHAKEREHFGMVVAEYVASGMIPFVPNSGGQQEIVGRISNLTYDSWNSLYNKIESVISDPNLQNTIRDKLSSQTPNLTQNQFREQIADIVEWKLSEDQDNKI